MSGPQPGHLSLIMPSGSLTLPTCFPVTQKVFSQEVFFQVAIQDFSQKGMV